MNASSSIRFCAKDANEAVADVAYRLTETVAIYPITPSSPMAEHCDEWSSVGRKNIWGVVPDVVQMQSEGGVAGAVHGALMGGALSTTFTASQGLLLMIPNMYKIAGELTPFCLHVTARSLAAHALSIFGDHSDVMACRQTGFAMLASASVQEAQDLAAVAHMATLRSRVPFLHFFDGFRTSHEINSCIPLSDEELGQLIDEESLLNHRMRALNPDRPFIRGTAQNPDVFFQAREAGNRYYEVLPEILDESLEQFARVTGRRYALYEYSGDPEASEVVIVMASGSETCEETSMWLNDHGRKTGVLRVRLFRPFSTKHLVAQLPLSVRKIAVLDRTKEAGALGEPLYQDVVTALAEARAEGLLPAGFSPVVVGGRYGLGSKEFNPAMAKAVFDNLVEVKPKNHFTVGINDDVTGTSLSVDESFRLRDMSCFQAVFLGLGSDGTVGANKNSIKIIADGTGKHAQAYFVYDSKKSGAMTVSHLRFGPNPIRAPYLISEADFVGCHQPQFLRQYDIVKYAASGGVLLINTGYKPEKVWESLPQPVRDGIRQKHLKLYAIDAYATAREAGMGGRINTIMQTCFFAISGVIAQEKAIAAIKTYITKSYGRKGAAIVEKNHAAVDRTLQHLHRIEIPEHDEVRGDSYPEFPQEAPDFIKRVTAVMLKGEGDLLPVSAFPVDGTWPTGSSRWEKRNIAQEVPIWDPEICIQCGKCAVICPHASIRAKCYHEDVLDDAPEGFLSAPFKSRELERHRFTIQVAPEDCTGCNLCVTVCPAKNKANPRLKALQMRAHDEVVEREKVAWDFFKEIPRTDALPLEMTVKSSQLRDPLFEFSGACAGCGETPYIKLLTQLFGDRLLIANATGCSSIYGGNLPTTPYCTDVAGRGPAWANSLFEDNAEFGLGLRLAVDKLTEVARELLHKLAPKLGDIMVRELLMAEQRTELDILAQRDRVAALDRQLRSISGPEAVLLRELSGYLVKKVVWSVGGDGWAYDIGFGGLDHVMASGRDLNILVLDTEVYSNTGGQSSKSTPMGAVAKFASAGKQTPKKDLGMLAMGYGNVYVATVALGANDGHTVRVLAEAESFDGPSLVIAYSHCIAHGYNMNFGPDQQKKAVMSGHWPLYRHDPRRLEQGLPAFQLDSKAPSIGLREYMENEVRYRMMMTMHPKEAAEVIYSAEQRIQERYGYYQELATGFSGKTSEKSSK